jgi:hypothetical protein
MIKVKHLKRKNPKDEEFLELIRIERKDYPRLYHYKVYFRNELIGIFDIKKNFNYIQEMEIFEEKYKRRGLAMFMHDYIEQDLGIKIVTSKALSKEGKSFYQAREKSKKKNPTDHQLLEEIKIQKLKITEDDYSSWGDPGQILYRIIGDNRILGQARYDPKQKVVDDITVYECKRQGLATYLYDYIEADQKIILKPSEELLDGGKAFWKARRKAKK